MRRKFQTGAGTVLLIGAIAALGLVIREYRHDKDACQLLYTISIKKKDIVDAARNALSALNDAEIREQDYVLTGETVYSQAYADDIDSWQDESAALALVARNDPGSPIVQEFSKAGKRTLDELAQVVSLYEKDGRDAALERIRKSSGIVYLDLARNNVTKLQEIDGGRFDGSYEINGKALSSLKRLAAGAIAIFFLTVTGALLLLVKTPGDRRRGREGSISLEAVAHASD